MIHFTGSDNNDYQIRDINAGEFVALLVNGRTVRNFGYAGTDVRFAMAKAEGFAVGMAGGIKVVL